MYILTALSQCRVGQLGKKFVLSQLVGLPSECVQCVYREKDSVRWRCFVYNFHDSFKRPITHYVHLYTCNIVPDSLAHGTIFLLVVCTATLHVD